MELAQQRNYFLDKLLDMEIKSILALIAVPPLVLSFFPNFPEVGLTAKLLALIAVYLVGVFFFARLRRYRCLVEALDKKLSELNRGESIGEIEDYGNLHWFRLFPHLRLVETIVLFVALVSAGVAIAALFGGAA